MKLMAHLRAGCIFTLRDELESNRLLAVRTLDPHRVLVWILDGLVFDPHQQTAPWTDFDQHRLQSMNSRPLPRLPAALTVVRMVVIS